MGGEKEYRQRLKYVVASGISKGSISRRFARVTPEALAELLDKPLDGIDLVVPYIDGVVVAEHTVVCALGIDINGSGAWQATENYRSCGCAPRARFSTPPRARQQTHEKPSEGALREFPRRTGQPRWKPFRAIITTRTPLPTAPSRSPHWRWRRCVRHLLRPSSGRSQEF